VGVMAQIRDRHHRVAELAALQCGVISRRQLLDAGFGIGAIEYGLAQGRLHRLHRGVYAAGHTAPVAGAREWATVLASGAGVVVSHRSAAVLWGLLAERQTQMPVEVTALGRRVRARRGIVVHHRRPGPPEDCSRREGLPITTPARTILDLAAASPRAAERAFEQAAVLRLAGPPKLRAALERDPRARGAVAVRALLRGAEDPALTRSQAEARLLAMIRAAALPRPQTNVQVLGYEVDMLWSEQHLVVEVDGFRFHGHRSAFERDRRRANRLQLAGYRVLRVTWRRIDTEPLALVTELALALAGGAR